MSFEIEITSVPDRDEIVAEIWRNDEMVAEVRRTTKGSLALEIYSSKSSEPWLFDFHEWISALTEAKHRLR